MHVTCQYCVIWRKFHIWFDPLHCLSVVLLSPQTSNWYFHVEHSLWPPLRTEVPWPIATKLPLHQTLVVLKTKSQNFVQAKKREI